MFTASNIILHGVLMDIHGLGVLLSGAAGIGKSEAALELVRRGHRLVADDAPSFRVNAEGKLHGICPETLRDFLAVRDLGILNIRALFGDEALASSVALELIVELYPARAAGHVIETNPVKPMICSVLGIDIARIRLGVAPVRNIPTLVECLARNQQLLSGGYDAMHDFRARQQAAMRRAAP